MNLPGPSDSAPPPKMHRFKKGDKRLDSRPVGAGTVFGVGGNATFGKGRSRNYSNRTVGKSANTPHGKGDFGRFVNEGKDGSKRKGGAKANGKEKGNHDSKDGEDRGKGGKVTITFECEVALGALGGLHGWFYDMGAGEQGCMQGDVQMMPEGMVAATSGKGQTPNYSGWISGKGGKRPYGTGGFGRFGDKGDDKSKGKGDVKAKGKGESKHDSRDGKGGDKGEKVTITFFEGEVVPGFQLFGCVLCRGGQNITEPTQDAHVEAQLIGSGARSCHEGEGPVKIVLTDGTKEELAEVEEHVNALVSDVRMRHDEWLAQAASEEEAEAALVSLLTHQNENVHSARNASSLAVVNTGEVEDVAQTLESIQVLRDAITKNLHVLSHLSLSKNQIGDGGVKALAESLKNNLSLQTLTLNWNQISELGAQALAECLKSNSSLKQLLLGENQIGNSGAQALSEGLKTNASLTKLGLWGNQIGDPGAQALSETLKINATLTELGLEYNQIANNGAHALSESLKMNASLTSLDLEVNQIWYPGARALSESLKTNASLTNLNLNDNRIGNSGAQAFAECLRYNSSLKELLLGWNGIGNLGLKAFADGLKSNSSLKELWLGWNEIGNVGAEALSEGLTTNASLMKLVLDVNQIGDSGARAFSESLNKNKCLGKLCLYLNKIGPLGKQALQQHIDSGRVDLGYQGMF